MLDVSKQAEPMPQLCSLKKRILSSAIGLPILLGSKKPGPQGQVRVLWLCPYKSTGVMEYWSVGVLI